MRKAIDEKCNILKDYFMINEIRKIICFRQFDSGNRRYFYALNERFHCNARAIILKFSKSVKLYFFNKLIMHKERNKKIIISQFYYS